MRSKEEQKKHLCYTCKNKCKEKLTDYSPMIIACNKYIKNETEQPEGEQESLAEEEQEEHEE